jgi:competence protein ComEC
VVRATVMAVVFLFARLVRREPDIYNSCAAAALFILLAKPRQLFDIGFQLSFASVIAIIWLYPKIKAWLHLETLSNRGVRFIIDGCLVSFSAWLGTAGFIVYYFKIFSPITVLANVIIVPLATFITLCGFSIVLISPFAPGLSRQFVPAAEIAILLLVKINAFLISFPCASVYLG